MYHCVKFRRKKRRKGNRLLKLCFVLVGAWALMLGLLAAEASTLSPTTDVMLVFRGETHSVPASGQTAGELLHNLELEVTQQDVVSLPLDTVLAPGSRFTVELRQTRQEVYTLSIPPETEYRLDSTLPWGKENVLAEGTTGEIRCTAQVDYVNGVEVHREVTEKQLLYPAENRLIAVGTCENPLPSSGSGYLWLPEGQMLTYTHTAYAEATGFTAADPGALPDSYQGIAAVDPSFIPPGSRLYIMASDGSFLYGIAEARASQSMEGNRIDLFFPTAQGQADFGRRNCTVYFLG